MSIIAIRPLKCSYDPMWKRPKWFHNCTKLDYYNTNATGRFIGRYEVDVSNNYFFILKRI